MEYDFIKAKETIEQDTDFDFIESASLGMEEDWSWTAETVYQKGAGFVTDLAKIKEIAGISGSTWATPLLQICYVDGEEKNIPIGINKHFLKQQKSQRGS